MFRVGDIVEFAGIKSDIIDMDAFNLVLADGRKVDYKATQLISRKVLI